MQEMKRRYASIYIPDETIDDQFNEHCGVCDEQGIEEAVLADRDYKYDGKVIKISKKNFSKVHRDFKGTTKGKETMLTYDDKEGTVLVPVQFTEDVEINEISMEAGKVYHQDFGGGEISYFRADSVLKNNRWKGMTVDEIGGRQQRPKNITADEKTQGWKETPKNEIPKGLKEEVEITEAVHDKKSTFTMAPFEDLRSVADVALKIMQGQPQEVKEEEVTKEESPQKLTEEIV